MIFPFVLALLTAIVIAALLAPLLRRRFVTPARLDQELALYKEQLLELERERKSEFLGESEAKAARTEIERRILVAASRAEGEAAKALPARRWLPTVIAILVPLVSLGVYFHTGKPELPAQPLAGRQKPPEMRTAETAAMESIRRLRQRIEKDPRDVNAHLALGRAQLTIGRIADALISFRTARDVAPERADVQSALGEALTFESDGIVTQPARTAFLAALTSDPKSPSARFYLGLADAQAGDAAAALKRWLDLEADSPEGAPWLTILAREIERVSKQAGIDPASVRPDRRQPRVRDPGMPQPSLEDVKRLEELPPEQRDEQIRAMVDRLAERLKTAPDDLEGWRRLGRARGVLGQHELAAEAYAAADKLKPDDPEILQAWAEALLRRDDAGVRLLPDTVAALRRLEKVRPENGLVLFFLAQADEEAGNLQGAVGRLRRLRDLMPVDSAPRSAIEQRLRALEARL